MFDSRSRYFELDDLHYQDVHGRTIVYRSRRFLPRDLDAREWWSVEAGPSDRPDLLADRTLRNPDLFWRICDANGVVHPLELTKWSGRKIRIPMPGV
jgi:hypothetical protein